MRRSAIQLVVVAVALVGCRGLDWPYLAGESDAELAPESLADAAREAEAEGVGPEAEAEVAPDAACEAEAEGVGPEAESRTEIDAENPSQSSS